MLKSPPSYPHLQTTIRRFQHTEQEGKLVYDIALAWLSDLMWLRQSLLPYMNSLFIPKRIASEWAVRNKQLEDKISKLQKAQTIKTPNLLASLEKMDGAVMYFNGLLSCELEIPGADTTMLLEITGHVLSVCTECAKEIEAQPT